MGCVRKVEPDRIGRLLSYESLTVDPLELATLWPKKGRLYRREEKGIARGSSLKGLRRRRDRALIY